jgi:hypothetical protein
MNVVGHSTSANQSRVLVVHYPANVTAKIVLPIGPDPWFPSCGAPDEMHQQAQVLTGHIWIPFVSALRALGVIGWP